MIDVSWESYYPWLYKPEKLAEARRKSGIDGLPMQVADYPLSESVSLIIIMLVS